MSVYRPTGANGVRHALKGYWFRELFRSAAEKIASEHSCAPYGDAQSWERVAQDKSCEERVQAAGQGRQCFVCRECGEVWRAVGSSETRKS